MFALEREPSEGVGGEGDPFDARAQVDDGADFVCGVRIRGDDEEAGEEVRGDAVGVGGGVGSGGGVGGGGADGDFAAVGGEDDDGRDGGFERAAEVGEGFEVEHVHLGS